MMYLIHALKMTCRLSIIILNRMLKLNKIQTSIAIFLILIAFSLYIIRPKLIYESFTEKMMSQTDSVELVNSVNQLNSYILKEELNKDDKTKINSIVYAMRTLFQKGIDNGYLNSPYKTNVIDYLLSSSTILKLVDENTPFIIKKGLIKKIIKWVTYAKNGVVAKKDIHYSTETPSSVEEDEIDVVVPKNRITIHSAGSKNASYEANNLENFDPGRDNGGYNLFKVKKITEDDEMFKTYFIKDACMKRTPGTPLHLGEVPSALDIVNDVRDIRYKSFQYFSVPRLCIAETTHGKNSLNDYAARYYIKYSGNKTPKPEEKPLYHIMSFDRVEKTFSNVFMIRYDGSITTTKENHSIENTLFLLEDEEENEFDFAKAEENEVKKMALCSYGYKGLRNENYYFYQYFNDTGGNVEKIITKTENTNPYIFKYIPVQY